MSSPPDPVPGDSATFLRVARTGDVARAVAIIDEHWLGLLFHPDTSSTVFEVIGAATAEDLAGHTVASLIAETIGALPRGSVWVQLPRNHDDLRTVIRTGRARRVLSIAIHAMVRDRVSGSFDRALSAARVTRPLLEATNATKFSPTTDLAGYWYLQAAQAALHAGDFARARLDLEHAWSLRHLDVTGYVEPSVAPFGVLVAALTGDVGEEQQWREAWAEISEASATLIDADTMARPVLVADLLRAGDRLDDAAAAPLARTLAGQLAHDELWSVTLFALVRHHIDVGRTDRAEVLLASCSERHPSSAAAPSLHQTFAALARAEVDLARGRLHSVDALVDLSCVQRFPGTGEVYAARSRLSAGDVTGARHLALRGESLARRPRVIQACRHLVRVCDLALGRDAEPTDEPDRAVSADLNRLTAHLPAQVHRLVAARWPGTPALRGASHQLNESPLSRAERRTLGALCTESTVAAAARSLHVSPNTVKSQARSIYRKLGVSSRDEMVAVARRDGLLDCPQTADHTSRVR